MDIHSLSLINFISEVIRPFLASNSALYCLCHRVFSLEIFIKIIVLSILRACSSMDRTLGFGPGDLGSIPSRLVISGIKISKNYFPKTIAIITQIRITIADIICFFVIFSFRKIFANMKINIGDSIDNSIVV